MAHGQGIAWARVCESASWRFRSQFLPVRCGFASDLPVMRASQLKVLPLDGGQVVPTAAVGLGVESPAEPVPIGTRLSAEARSSDLNDSSLYLNPELSLVEFQRRVLEEVRDARNPLLERVKFLSILSSNLDEFFMVRV